MKDGRLYELQQWKRVREMQLRREPFCCVCAALGDPDNLANQVDHIVPVARGGAPFNPSNLQSLCGPHHSIKTNTIDKKGLTWSAFVAPGCDADGNPLDPNHPFYA